MNNQISLSIKKLINESFIDNIIDSAANTLKAHKCKIALVGGTLAYHYNPEFRHISKNIGHAIADPLMQKPQIAKSVNDIKTAITTSTS